MQKKVYKYYNPMWIMEKGDGVLCFNSVSYFQSKDFNTHTTPLNSGVIVKW